MIKAPTTAMVAAVTAVTTIPDEDAEAEASKEIIMTIMVI
jgi:hypothetical protein